MNVSDSWLNNHHVEQGRTGTTFQERKSHTHPGHPILPQQIVKPRYKQIMKSLFPSAIYCYEHNYLHIIAKQPHNWTMFAITTFF